MPPDWATLDRALNRALDLEGPEREAFLASLDEATREALAPLLRDALREDADRDPGGGPITGGVRVGPYEIEALVGEGGMGRVLARVLRRGGTWQPPPGRPGLRKAKRGVASPCSGTGLGGPLRRSRQLPACFER